MDVLLFGVVLGCYIQIVCGGNQLQHNNYARAHSKSIYRRRQPVFLGPASRPRIIALFARAAASGILRGLRRCNVYCQAYIYIYSTYVIIECVPRGVVMSCCALRGSQIAV